MKEQAADLSSDDTMLPAHHETISKNECVLTAARFERAPTEVDQHLKLAP